MTDPAAVNVRRVVELERGMLGQIPMRDRVSMIISNVAGSLWFVIAHVLIFAVWAAWNLGVVPGVELFDPYPFGLLTMIVSMEGVLVAAFVLVTQNWMTRQADRRAHLDLQINMLTEQEITKVLSLLEAIARHVGLEDISKDPQLHGFLETDVDRVVEHLKDNDPVE